MNKYFSKNEAETIISLFNSGEKENIKLAINLIRTNKKYKNFKKLYCDRFTYYNYKYNIESYLNALFKYPYNCYSKYYQDTIIKFIQKRIK